MLTEQQVQAGVAYLHQHRISKSGKQDERPASIAVTQHNVTVTYQSTKQVAAGQKQRAHLRTIK